MNPESWMTGSATAAALAAAVGQLAGALRLRQPRRKRRTTTASRSTSLQVEHQRAADASSQLAVLLSDLRCAVQEMNDSAVQRDDDRFDGANRELVEIAHSIDELLDEIEQMVRPASTDTSAQHPSRSASLAALPAMLQQAAFPDGLKHPRIFMSTGSTFDASGQAYTIRIAGNEGTQKLTFASSTAQFDMITAINQFTDKTGVYAVQEPRRLAWIRLTSKKRGPDQFVAAKKVSGNIDNMLRNEWGGHPANRQIDFGE